MTRTRTMTSSRTRNRDIPRFGQSRLSPARFGPRLRSALGSGIPTSNTKRVTTFWMETPLSTIVSATGPADDDGATLAANGSPRRPSQAIDRRSRRQLKRRVLHSTACRCLEMLSQSSRRRGFRGVFPMHPPSMALHGNHLRLAGLAWRSVSQ